MKRALLLLSILAGAQAQAFFQCESVTPDCDYRIYVYGETIRAFASNCQYSRNADGNFAIMRLTRNSTGSTTYHTHGGGVLLVLSRSGKSGKFIWGSTKVDVFCK